MLGVALLMAIIGSVGWLITSLVPKVLRARLSDPRVTDKQRKQINKAVSSMVDARKTMARMALFGFAAVAIVVVFLLVTVGTVSLFSFSR